MRSSPAKGWAAVGPVVAAREGRSRARGEIRREFLSERRERLEKRNGADEPDALRSEASSGRASSYGLSNRSIKFMPQNITLNILNIYIKY